VSLPHCGGVDSVRGKGKGGVVDSAPTGVAAHHRTACYEADLLSSQANQIMLPRDFGPRQWKRVLAICGIASWLI